MTQTELLEIGGGKLSHSRKNARLLRTAPTDRTDSPQPAGKAKDAFVRDPRFACSVRCRLKRMLFPTTHFLLFFLVVAGVVAALEHRFTAKKAVLVVASYYFYAQ